MRNPQQQRQQLRRKIRQQRQQLSQRQCCDYRKQFFKVAQQQQLLLNYQHIAAYLPIGGEADVTLILAQALKQKKSCYLPVVKPKPEMKLWFSPYYSVKPQQQSLKTNHFGILEPSHIKYRSVWSLDLILMPLVAFDLNGNRLGMGAGYYDRTLAYLQHRQYWLKPVLIGVAYEFQQVDKLPYQYWDIPLQGVLTEKQLYWF